VDWGELQVRNSSNFCNHWAGDVFAFLNGSINYQIEHHLFPGMNHIHLPRIAPIVRQTCEEFHIPYAAYFSLSSAWYSFLVTCRSVMTLQQQQEQQAGRGQEAEKTE
jgi:fatty acid desaturase